MEMKQSYSTSEVARFCHVTPDTIRKWAEAGRIQVFKTPGGHRRIRREDLLRFLRENNIPIHAELDNSAVKVLGVDGEKQIALVIRRFLERSQKPFQLEVAADGYDAGHQVATFQPDVVFLDMALAGVDGIDVCRRIKGSPEHVGTQIIAMTNNEDPAPVDRILENGATACLSKPFSPDDLRRALARVGVELS